MLGDDRGIDSLEKDKEGPGMINRQQKAKCKSLKVSLAAHTESHLFYCRAEKTKGQAQNLMIRIMGLRYHIVHSNHQLGLR